MIITIMVLLFICIVWAAFDHKQVRWFLVGWLVVGIPDACATYKGYGLTWYSAFIVGAVVGPVYQMSNVLGQPGVQEIFTPLWVYRTEDRRPR